ncbi:DUF362 domain-containing protein [Actinomycetota bacterium]
MDTVIIKEIKEYNSSVNGLLEELDFGGRLDDISRIVIKPNLLQDSPPPCTTDVECVEAVIKYIKTRNNSIPTTILEGSGGCETSKAFKTLGYEELAENYGITLMDVDQSPLVKLENKNARVYKEIYLPEIIFDSYLISIPVLKDHSMTTVTLGLKNMIGLLHKKHYGNYWSYNRSDVHRVGVDEAIADLNDYIDIDLTIIDGRLGQEGSHLSGGRVCLPVKSVVIGGYDVLEVDKAGAGILGHDWENVRHLKMIDEKQG